MQSIFFELLDLEKFQLAEMTFRMIIGDRARPVCWISCCMPLCLKKRPTLTCYNLDIHDPITITFGRSVSEKVSLIRNQTMLCFPTSLSSASALPRKRGNPEDSALVLCACDTVRNCCVVLDFLSAEPCLPKAPRWSRTHWLQDIGSHKQCEYESLLASQKDWRNQAATGWILAML